VGLEPSELSDAVAEWIDAHAELVDARGRLLVAGHGDLRAEHVLLGDPPLFIDALDLLDVRVDPLDELGYLALECERLGASWARGPLLEPWRRVSGDDAPDALVDLYQVFRAGLRASLYALRVDDGSGDPADMRRRSVAWLDAGRRHAAMLRDR
jgi:aminoglycoside phosphotransferase family enzyme